MTPRVRYIFTRCTKRHIQIPIQYPKTRGLNPKKSDGEDDRGGLLRVIFSKLQSNRVQAATSVCGTAG